MIAHFDNYVQTNFLLSFVSKVLERLVYRKCSGFLQSSLSPAQFSFQKCHSAVQQLLLFYNVIFEDSCSSAQYDVIFLDFAKAFNSVPHQELLLKLKLLGVSRKIWLWLKEYLTGRMQCVCLGGMRSEVLPVISGVPQGSILGPLLFLPDVNKHSLMLLFADDTKCLKKFLVTTT